MAHVIVFDVNGTLLDMSALDPRLTRVFGDPLARERWFKELQGLWMTTIATGAYQAFDTLAQAALGMVAEREGAGLNAADRAAVMEEMNTLPAYGDAAGALQRLRDGGLRLAALTNGTLKSARAQLEHAGLHGFFEAVMSADEVKRYKPAPEPYHMAAERLEVKPGQMRLVAAHAWDIAGAHAAGLKTAFVARPRKVLNPAGPDPDLRAHDLMDLADQILRKDG